jgi:hypothetical protein
MLSRRRCDISGAAPRALPGGVIVAPSAAAPISRAPSILPSLAGSSRTSPSVGRRSLPSWPRRAAITCEIYRRPRPAARRICTRARTPRDGRSTRAVGPRGDMRGRGTPSGRSEVPPQRRRGASPGWIMRSRPVADDLVRLSAMGTERAAPSKGSKGKPCKDHRVTVRPRWAARPAPALARSLRGMTADLP